MNIEVVPLLTRVRVYSCKCSLNQDVAQGHNSANKLINFLCELDIFMCVLFPVLNYKSLV
jgi:hypothetical protein